ncbi:MAG: DUF5320 family protein [Bacteroidetes bacterium]|nr:DUF5320 family protein [Bacteroidota bacterium]
MPNLNGTGPEGKGALTGRRRGRCRESQIENSENQTADEKELKIGLGRGGRPRGRGLGNRFGGGFGKEQGRGRVRGLGNM